MSLWAKVSRLKIMRDLISNENVFKSNSKIFEKIGRGRSYVVEDKIAEKNKWIVPAVRPLFD